MSPTTFSALASSRSPIRSLLHRAALLAFLPTWITSAHAELKLVERWPTDEKVCVDAPLRLTFDQPPVLGSAGKIEVCLAADGKPVESITLGETQFVDEVGTAGGAPSARFEHVRVDGNTVCIRLRARSLAYGKTYFVRIEPEVVQNFAGVAEGWKFTTKAALPRNPEQLVVAADGSGDFCTVQGAVDQIDPHRTKPATISIRKGHYEGLVRVPREKPFLRLVGEDRKGTVIACTNNDKLNPGWIQRAVLGVEADDFSLENITVQNTTPYRGSQAEAVAVNAKRCNLRNADFISTQDTMHLSGSAHVADCYIEGDVDYLWGYGSVLFEKCELRSSHDGYIVQSRNPPGQNGFVFVDCKLTAAPEVKKVWLARIETGRFPESHVAFIRCQMGPHIPAAGWLVTGPDVPNLRFAEFQSTDLSGHPLDVSQRIPSSKQLSEKDAAQQSEAARTFASAASM